MNNKQPTAIEEALRALETMKTVYGAGELVPVESVQVSGVSYYTIGEAGLSYLRHICRLPEARVAVPSFMNPAGMDLEAYREMGVPQAFADGQREIVDLLVSLGVQPTLTCTPYLAGFCPTLGAHLAWAESSAVSMANSLFGARTNREGGPSALASALAGVTGLFGLHLPRERQPTLVVDVRCPLTSAEDMGLMGLAVAKHCAQAVPLFQNLDPALITLDGLKSLAAAMAAAGSVALFHIPGVTAEAKAGLLAAPRLEHLIIDGLDAQRADMAGPKGLPLDLVALGCPHASLEEIRQVTGLIEGRRLGTKLWVTTSRHVAAQAEREGLVDILAASGALLVRDTCAVVAPLEAMGLRRIATNSVKAAFYLRSRPGFQVAFGPLDLCLAGALTGTWSGEEGPAPTRRHIPPPPRAEGPIINNERHQGPISLTGRALVPGEAQGRAMVSEQPISFFGGVHPTTGVVQERGHPLEGRSLAGKILVFPSGKGSTVGSYVLFSLSQAGAAPLAMVTREADSILAMGALMAHIPLLDQVQGLSLIQEDSWVRVQGGEVEILDG